MPFAVISHLIGGWKCWNMPERNKTFSGNRDTLLHSLKLVILVEKIARDELLRAFAVLCLCSAKLERCHCCHHTLICIDELVGIMY